MPHSTTRASGAGRVARRLAQRPPRDQLHDQEIDALLAVEIVDRGDVRMVEPRERPRLVAEAAARVLVGQGPRGEQLDRDGALEVRVPRAEHDPHPAGADLLEQPVVAEPALRAGARARLRP